MAIEKITINNEEVYIRKNWLGWRVVYPGKIDGKINWFNLIFGGKQNLFVLCIYILIAIILFIGIKQLISNYEIIANNPCKYCINCFQNNIGLKLP